MKSKIELLLYDTYITAIKNSVGSKMFRNSYAKIEGKKIDILQNGKLSCAFYVSFVLVPFRLIKELHATVSSTIKDLMTSGWKAIKKPKVGSILVWEEIDFGKNDKHKHIGFYIGDKEAVSNSRNKKTPIKHHWTFGGKRKVEMILWNSNLDG